MEVTKHPSLLPYTEMIFAAVDALKPHESTTKSSISNYIESTYGDLPEEHAFLLTDHLNKLMDSGELLLVKNNYIRPDPTAPLKRGRGRPPKSKDPASSEIQIHAQIQFPALTPTSTPAPTPAPAHAQAQPGSDVKRGRGRPKKDPNAPPAPKKVKVPSVPPPPSKTGRPRGRPRKVQPELAGVEAN